MHFWFTGSFLEPSLLDIGIPPLKGARGMFLKYKDKGKRIKEKEKKALYPYLWFFKESIFAHNPLIPNPLILMVFSVVN